jgi:hypothetical protein
MFLIDIDAFLSSGGLYVEIDVMCAAQEHPINRFMDRDQDVLG